MLRTNKKAEGKSRFTRAFFLSEKKAMGIDFLVGIIIVLAAFAVIAPIAAKYVGEDESKIESLCQSSVAVRAKTALDVAGAEARLSPVLCKTIDKKIEGTKDQVMRQLADKMAKCWEMFGEGKYKQNIFDNLAIMGGEKRCFMCYTMIIEESKDFKEGDKITAEEFKNFLINTEHSKLKGWKYLDYIQQHGGNGQILGIISQEGITPDHAYAIGYKAKKSTCSWCPYLGVGGTVALGVGAIILALPTGGLSLAGLGLAVGGGTLAATSAKEMIDEKFFSDVNIDTIYIIDMGNKPLNDLFQKTCEEIEGDIEGK